MQSTNPKQLRSELKDYLDQATSEPIRIVRRSGESFVLMNEQNYADMQIEIASLQRRLLSMSDILNGKTKEWTNNTESRLNRFKK